MSKIRKWIGFGHLSILVLVLLIALGSFIITSTKLNKTYNVQVELIPLPINNKAIERGKHWVISECTHRHCLCTFGFNTYGSPIERFYALQRIWSYD